MAKTWLVTDEHGERAVTVVRDDGQTAVVEVDGQRMTVTTQRLPDGRVAVSGVGEDTRAFRSWRDHRGTWISAGPVARLYVVESEQQRLLGALVGGAGGGGEIRASMPGRVVRVSVAVGDRVEQGAVLAVLEAMKMENDVKSPVSGEVTEVAVSTGDAVDADALLVRIEPDS